MKFTIYNGQQRYAGPMGFVTRIIVMTLAVILVDWILPNVEVDGIWTAIITSLVIAVLNNFVRPILIVLTLPFTMVSLGLFLFVINAIIVWLTSELVAGFHIRGFGSAILFSLLLTAISFLLELPNKMMSKQDYQEPTVSSNNDTDDEGFTPYEEVKDDEEKN